jgi:Mn2+/Fe2+ NRAMP family transporter
MSVAKAAGERPKRSPQKKKGALRKFFAALGPGAITGAADDDPSGVATYTVTGAQSGTALLWTAFITWPLMAAVQMTCARVGMVTGEGLAGAFCRKFPRALIALVCVALFAANTINIGSDLAGMADAATMLTRVNAHLFVVLFGGGIAFITIRFHYIQIAKVLKWLCLVLFAYVIVAFRVVSDWPGVLRDAFSPSWPSDHNAWTGLVAILGTTISPYLFFWQASQEVEEEKAAGRRMAVRRRGATAQEINVRRLDVGVGTFASNLVMFFIIVTAAMTLHRHGMTNIESSRQAAEALRPLAGRLAALLYTLGIVGVGLLAIPTLAGSAAYALAEALRCAQGLEKKFTRAKLFYGVIIAAVGLGILLNYLKINPVKALYWTGVLNGLLAPVLLLGILIVASDKKLMNRQPSRGLARYLVMLTAMIMFAAAVGMFVF